MKQYIDKAAVVTGINDWRDKIKKSIFSIPLSGKERAYATYEYEVLGKVISFLDSLGVKEVDLEKEFDKCCEDYIFDDEWDVYIAKHFFKLGLKIK